MKISIMSGELRKESAAMSAAREQARIAASGIDSTAEVPSHRIVAATAAKLRKAKPDADSILVSAGGSGIISTLIDTGSIDRFELVLNRIAAAAAALGITLEAREKGAAFLCDGEVVGFEVTELTWREKHVLTEKEQKEHDAWKKKRDRYWAKRSTPRGWDDDDDYGFEFPPRFPEWDYHPTGQLSFELDQHYFWDASPRRSFRDAKVQRLELIAGDVAVGIAVYAAALKADRLRREEEARRREDEQQRRERAARADHIQKRRVGELNKVLEELAALERLRGLVSTLRYELGSESGGRVGTFVEFAYKRLVAREAAYSAEGLATRFETDRIFGDDDDHDFYPSRYY